jgi:quinohemoprotein ethanol dehydrogenase
MKNGGTMTTAGNLVFQGTVQGELVAYAADTGQRLWAFDAQNGIMAQPITYSVGGRQYLTVISGWRMSTAPGPGLEWDYVTQRRRVLTFALDAHATLPAADRSPRPFVDDATFLVDETQATRGAAIYGTRCAVCHGGALRAGGSAPDLRKAAAPISYPAFHAVLHEGLLTHNGMPRFEELEMAEIEALQHYIRQQARHAANMAITGAAH